MIIKHCNFNDCVVLLDVEIGNGSEGELLSCHVFS